MNGMHEWQIVCEESKEYEQRRTLRMRVPGGFLYRYELNTPVSEESCQLALAMMFVPQPSGIRVKAKKKSQSKRPRRRVENPEVPRAQGASRRSPGPLESL